MTLINLFWAFLKSGTLGFGGGQAMIPLIENEAVHRYALISSNDFFNTVAISQALPGPIATKLAVSIGFEAAGFLGSLIALIAVVLPSSLAIIIVFQVLNRFSDIAFVRGIQLAAKPLVVALILGVGITLGVSLLSTMGISTFSTNVILWSIFVGVLILYLLNSFTGLYFPTAFIVVVFLLIGGFILS